MSAARRAGDPGAGNRCPDCQATNPEGATWCGQCYHPLGDARAPEAARQAGTASGAADVDEEAGVDGQAGVDEEAGVDGQDGHGFRTREGAVEWSCTACGTFNALWLGACAVCGTPLTARFSAPAARSGSDETDWRAALALTLLLPGAGHVLAGRPATGGARALLYLVWLGGGLLLLGGGGAALAAGPLLLGALAVWVGSVLDVVSLPRQGVELLHSRTLLWLVVGVTVLSVIGLVASFVSLA